MAFVLVGLFLVVLGVGDLLRAVRDLTTVRRRLAIVALGWTLLGAGVVALAPGVAGVLLWLGLAAAYALWVLGSSAALGSPPGAGSPAGPGPSGRGGSSGLAGPGRARALAFVGVGLGLAVGLVGGSVADASDWPGLLGRTAVGAWPVADVVVGAGALLVQLATANLLVRLLLDSVGVPATSNEKQLKGGRVLGPMERIFILTLGGLGEVTAAAIVVAAKGLLRFPELQRAVRLAEGEAVVLPLDPHGPAGAGDPRDLSGPTDVTEYFLIGSFASWLVAMAGVALVLLA